MNSNENIYCKFVFHYSLLDYTDINACFTIVSLSREKRHLSSSKFIFYICIRNVECLNHSDG